MKVLEILKSRIGAISRAGLLSVGLTGGLVALNVYNYVNDKPKALEPQIRSLSQIMASGGELPSEYSGISLSARGVDFATAEEQAKHEGALLAKFDGGEAQVDALGQIDALNVRGSVFHGGEAGLGLNQGAVEVGPNGGSAGGASGADGAGVGDAVAEANQTVINKLADANASLPRASMAKVNASGSSSSYSPYGNAGRVTANAPVAAAKIGPASISGAPTVEGSTLVHTPVSLKGATGSDFVASSRNVRYKGGLDSREGQSLRAIAVQSAKVAATSGKSANMHAQVFMTEDVRGLGTKAVGDEINTGNEGTGSPEDYEGDMNTKENNLGDSFEELDTTEQERNAHRSRLAKNMFLLMLGTIAAGFAINALMKSPDPWSKVGAAVLGAAMVAFIVLYMVDCIQYIQKYDEKQGWAIAGIVMGVLMLASIAVSFFNFSGAEHEALTSTAGEAMGTGGAEAGAAAGTEAAAGGSKFLAGLGKAAMMGGVGMGMEAGLSSGDAVLNPDKGGSGNGKS